MLGPGIAIVPNDGNVRGEPVNVRAAKPIVPVDEINCVEPAVNVIADCWNAPVADTGFATATVPLNVLVASAAAPVLVSVSVPVPVNARGASAIDPVAVKKFWTVTEPDIPSGVVLNCAVPAGFSTVTVPLNASGACAIVPVDVKVSTDVPVKPGDAVCIVPVLVIVSVTVPANAGDATCIDPVLVNVSVAVPEKAGEATCIVPVDVNVSTLVPLNAVGDAWNEPVDVIVSALVPLNARCAWANEPVDVTFVLSGRRLDPSSATRPPPASVRKPTGTCPIPKGDACMEPVEVTGFAMLTVPLNVLAAIAVVPVEVFPDAAGAYTA
jgi:hypothetical protein